MRFKSLTPIQNHQDPLSGRFQAAVRAGHAANCRVALPVQIEAGRVQSQTFYILSNVFKIDGLLNNLAQHCSNLPNGDGSAIHTAVATNDGQAGWMIDEEALVVMNPQIFADYGVKVGIDLTHAPEVKPA